MRKRQLLFRLFYSTTFSIFLVLEILLLLISPGDIIYQSFAASRFLIIIAVAIVYVLVLLVSAFILATRFYAAHTQLNSIPKSHLPVRKNELSRSLHKLVTSEYSRSASIAYHASPREVRQENIDALARETAKSRDKDITWSLGHMKSWRYIKHEGWSSPCVVDLPNLQFNPVLLEFPHLIEAKAVSLAPSDPMAYPSTPASVTEIMADLRAVEILQRSSAMSLRSYCGRLSQLGMLPSEEIVKQFLARYEKARFSSDLLTEGEFRTILEQFTTIIQTMSPPSQTALMNFKSPSPSLRSQSSNSSLSRSLRASTKVNSNPQWLSNVDKRTTSYSVVDGNLYTPLSRSVTPFLTPRANMYQGSLSSGHAGDQSSDDSDSDNNRSLHTAYTRPVRRNRTQNTSRYASAATNVNRGDGLGLEEPASDAGSVIHRTTSGQTIGSTRSFSSSLGSVIRREDQGESVLPIPLINSPS